MAEKKFNTRILLKYDSHENWTANDPVLKKGETAFTTVSVKQDSVVNEVPSVLIKVGDGTHKYSELDFVYAKAADVIAAAKSEDALTKFVNNVIAGAGIASDEAMEALATRVTTAEGKITTAEGKISTLEELVGENAVSVQIKNAIDALKLSETYDAKGSAAAVQGNLDTYKTTNDAAVKANADAITAIKDSETIDSFADVETALAGKQAAGDYATKAEAQGYADAKDNAIAAAKKAGDDAQADIDALELKVGTVPEDTTVVEMISEAQAAATYDDTELTGRVTTAEGKLTTLVGTDADKSVRTIANEELAAQLIPENAKESLDTLQEIAAWIQAHPDDASAMNTRIGNLETLVGDDPVANQINTAIEALKIGDYAKAADLTAAIGRIATLEADTHTHANKGLLDTYTQTESDLADAVAKKHAHDNKTVLDGITAEKVTAWDKVSEKANDADLAAIAKTGNVNDLVQTEGDIIIFDCGTSSTNI